MRFLRQHASEYHLDTDHMAVLGHSSAADLAMMVGFTPHLKQLEGNGGWEDQSSRVFAVVNIAGVCDRRSELGIRTMYLLGQGYAKNRELRELASPILHISKQSPPVYTLHGEQDEVVPLASARQFDAKLKQAGVGACAGRLCLKTPNGVAVVERNARYDHWNRIQLGIVPGNDHRALSNFAGKAKFARTRAEWKRLLHGHNNSEK